MRKLFCGVSIKLRNACFSRNGFLKENKYIFSIQQSNSNTNSVIINFFYPENKSKGQYFPM